MKSSSVLDVAVFAAVNHAKQVRRYTGEPYIVHPLTVANLVESAGCTPNVVKAALLHDVVEDCGVTLVELRGFFSTWDNRDDAERIVYLVDILTDRHTKEAFPDLTRVQRKACELNRWHGLWAFGSTQVLRDASLVKLADLLDNALSIKTYDTKFFEVYRKEAMDLCDVLYTGEAPHMALLKELAGVLGGLYP